MLQRRGTSFRTASAAMAALFFSQSTGVAQVASRMPPAHPVHLAAGLPPAGGNGQALLGRRALEGRAVPDFVPPAPMKPESSLFQGTAPSLAKPDRGPSAIDSMSDRIESGLLWLARRQAEGTAALDSAHDSIESGMLTLALLQHRAASVIDTAGMDLREGYRLWKKMSAARREEESSSSTRRNPFLGSIPGVREVPALWDPPPAPTAPDRMLIRPEALQALRGLATIEARRIAKPIFPRFEGKWRQQNGLRFRVNYLNPVGICHFSEMGLVYRIGSHTRLDTHVRFPREFTGTYPVYWPETVVRYQIEIENVGLAPRNDLRVLAVQEDFNRTGGPGLILGGLTDWSVPVLRLGERVVLEGVTRMSTSAEGRTSPFEQTHLTVLQEGKGVGGHELVDAPQAGLVDPPDF